ncbi:MAG: helix-turn-helix domain-containing protein [Chloroflexi bacterium]|nr:helix-turn-helix domain-containing protein [Chloroflexota bacterium]
MGAVAHVENEDGRELVHRTDPREKKTPEIIRKVLDALAHGHGYAAAAQIAGISRSTLYDWMQHDHELREALEWAYRVMGGDYYETLVHMACEGDPRMRRVNPRIIVMALKRRGRL